MHVTSKDSSYCDDWPVIIDMICITVVIATRSSNHVLMIMIIMWWQWWQLPSKFSAEKNKIKMASWERRSAPQLSLTKSDHYHLCPPRWKFAGRPSWQCDDDENLACIVAWHLYKVESRVAVAANVAHVHRVRDVVAQKGSLQRRKCEIMPEDDFGLAQPASRYRGCWNHLRPLEQSRLGHLRPVWTRCQPALD